MRNVMQLERTHVRAYVSPEQAVFNALVRECSRNNDYSREPKRDSREPKQ